MRVLGIRNQVLLLALAPPLLISILLGFYFAAQLAMGGIKIEGDPSGLQVQEYQILIHISLILFLGLGLAGLHALNLGLKVSRPVLELKSAVEAIINGNLSTRVNIASYHELNILGNCINTMAATLSNAQAELQQKIEQATLSLRRSLETIEYQNLELEMAREAAENANQSKSEFLANISHEIRTPLNGLVGFTHLLNKTTLNNKQQEYLHTIIRSSQTLLSIINDILDFSKIEAGKLNLEVRPMDLSMCIDETINLFAPHAHDKSLSVLSKVNEDIPKWIVADPLRIQQILSNLVSNAIKFTDAGSIIISAQKDFERDNEVIVRITVTDTGIGLTFEEQKNLFQAFMQVKRNSLAYQKCLGTGLGLAICKKLVQQMQGDIGVKSSPNEGSVFWFTFKAGKTIMSSDLAYTSPLPLPANFSSSLAVPRLRILAVDDNPDNLRLIKLLLEEKGHQVEIAEGGIPAINVFKQSKGFDLIFMDIRMPDIDGITAARLIRQFEHENEHTPIPIVALTAHALVSEKTLIENAGFNDFLTKPIDESILEATLHRWIPVSRLSDLSVNVEARSLPPTPNMSQIQTDIKIFDWTLAKKLAAGKPELAREFFEKLQDSLPETQEKINQAFEAENWESLEFVIHRLHGACCYSGVPLLKESAKNLEKLLQTRPVDKQRLNTDILQINTAIEQVKHYSLKTDASLEAIP